MAMPAIADLSSLSEWWLWFTRMENSKVLALAIFFSLFCAILLYVFTGRGRSHRLESYKHLPFADDDHEAPGGAAAPRKVPDHD